MGFFVCVSSEATCSSLFSLLPSLRPILLWLLWCSPIRPWLRRCWRSFRIPLRTGPHHSGTGPCDPGSSSRCPLTARGPLMLRLIPTTLEDTLLPVSLLDTHLARTPSPRALMPPPRDTSPTPT